MEDKYYIPEIEEFHWGFEYEAYNNNDWFFAESGPGWIKQPMYHTMSLPSIYGGINKRWVRVKYLDAGDIKKEGFTFLDNDDRLFFSKVIIHRGETAAVGLLYAPQTKWLLIDIGGNTVYAGQCKNKSKLKQVLKDIGA